MRKTVGLTLSMPVRGKHSANLTRQTVEAEAIHATRGLVLILSSNLNDDLTW